MQGAAQRINAGHDRTDLAIDNRGRRYVGGGVDYVTHRILHWRHCAQSRETGNETTVDNACSEQRRPISKTTLSATKLPKIAQNRNPTILGGPGQL